MILSVAALAQSPAVNPTDARWAAEQQQRQRSQPLNNEPVWSEVRAGGPQTTQVRGRETDVLIQPQGETWRTLRNSIVSPWAGWLIVLMVVVIAGFYSWKGTMAL